MGGGRRAMGSGREPAPSQVSEDARPAEGEASTAEPGVGDVDGASWRSLASVVAAPHRERRLRLLLDYDGTLVPIAPTPDLATPDEDLLALLEALARAPGLDVELVSGRDRATFDAWFGHLPLSLWAEHGLWHRPARGREWYATADVATAGLAQIQPMVEHAVASTPGSFIETKTASIAWHYRAAQRDDGARQAEALRARLADALIDRPLEVIEGRKVIEVRGRGISKALVARQVLADAKAGDRSRIVAIGDDRTDEDLFRALPASCVTIVVGARPSSARFRVADHRVVRELLRHLVITASESGDREPDAVSSTATRRHSPQA